MWTNIESDNLIKGNETEFVILIGNSDRIIIRSDW